MFSLFRLSKRVNQLEEEMLKLTRIVESRDLDWQDMRARVKRLLDRTEKAAVRLEAPEKSATEPQDASDGEPDTSLLTPSQRRLQDEVNRRRRLLGIKPYSREVS